METLELSTFAGRFNRLASAIHTAKENIVVGIVMMLLSSFVSVVCGVYYDQNKGGFEGENLLLVVWNCMAVLGFFFGLYVFCVGVSSIRDAYKKFNTTVAEMSIFANR